MDELICSEYQPGRRFLGRLPHGKDLITSIEDFCTASAIQMATFSVIGAVSSATVGAYDQKQHVYVTLTENAPMEILTCIGNVSLKDGAPAIHAHIVFCEVLQTYVQITSIKTFSFPLLLFLDLDDFTGMLTFSTNIYAPCKSTL